MQVASTPINSFNHHVSKIKTIQCTTVTHKVVTDITLIRKGMDLSSRKLFI